LSDLTDEEWEILDPIINELEFYTPDAHEKVIFAKS